jgi:hypothetical protein
MLVASLSGSQVFAADLGSSIVHAARQAAQTPASPARTENPYLLSGLGLMAGGAAILIYGTTRQTERFCTGVPPALTAQLNQPPVSCVDNTHGKPALMISGIVVASVGGVVLAMGEKKRASVSITRGAIVVQRQFGF